MDKKQHEYFKAKIKDLKKRIKETDNESLRQELENTEDAYSYMQTPEGYKRYCEVMSR